MSEQSRFAASSQARRLDALLELGRISRECPLDELMEAVAEVVERVLGFTIVVLNIYRPAWDDYEVVLVRGTQASRDALLHTVNARQGWEEAILQAANETVPGAFFIPGENRDVWAHLDPETVYEPESVYAPAPVEGETATDPWLASDGLFAPLRGTDGSMMGVLSLDVPVSGRRPSTIDLEMLVAVANHASFALESAHASAHAERHRHTLAGLLTAASRMAGETTVEGVLEQVCSIVVGELGFRTISAHVVREGVLDPVAWRGGTQRLQGQPEVPALELIRDLLAEGMQHGSALLPRERVLPASDPSQLSGRGERAWRDHRLLVPMGLHEGRLEGLLVIDDPQDRLLPDVATRQALRLLADQAVATLESIDRQLRLTFLASHDPLTGVRNRRDMLATIGALAARPEGVSVLMCDLDDFKRVNDRFGHDVGDRVLERFGEVLRENARAQDIPVRIGGEEFCLVLPGVEAQAALAVAERLRLATAGVLGQIVPGLTVSIGLACSADGSLDASNLLTLADRALYAAKVGGRDQSRVAGAEQQQARPAAA